MLRSSARNLLNSLCVYEKCRYVANSCFKFFRFSPTRIAALLLDLVRQINTNAHRALQKRLRERERESEQKYVRE